MIRMLPFVLFATAALLPSAQLPTQTPPNQRPEGRGAEQSDAERQAPDLAERTDEVLASWLITGSNQEVALAQLAAQQSKDPEVKQYAEQVVADHRAFIQELKPFAADTAGSKGDGKSRAEDKSRTDDRSRVEASAARDQAARESGSEFDHVGLIEELGKQCLQTARTQLQKSQGTHFDRTYMQLSMQGHRMANDALTVFQRHASPELAAVIGSGQRTVSAHLEKAKACCKRMDDKQVAARSPESSQ